MLLTQKEFSLLLLFIQNEGRVLRADYLYERVWKAPLGADNRTLKKHVSGLRKHLEDARSGFTIAVIRGDGYCFSGS
jgi:DNA-binding response OmpR family regulator